VSAEDTAGAARPDDLQVLRSVLYMPSSNARALDKARTIPADAIIFDLEDAVAPDAKQAAREQAVAAAGSGQYGRRHLTIRCNGLDTPWGGDDLAAAATAGASAVVVPKVSGADHLAQVVRRLEAAGAPDDLRVWPMVETPAGVFAVREIAGFERVACLVMGTNDLAKELRAALVPGRAPLVPHLATALLAAREAGVAIVDGVYNDVKDLEGFEAECRQGAQLGFDGKTLVHPTQVEVANRVWAPSDEQVEHARRVIAAFEEAAREGRGVVTVDGRMIENLHVDNARRTLAVADAIAALG
jgi:citrate lyase subunit beta / citryl-CoA lyase